MEKTRTVERLIKFHYGLFSRNDATGTWYSLSQTIANVFLELNVHNTTLPDIQKSLKSEKNKFGTDTRIGVFINI